MIISFFLLLLSIVLLYFGAEFSLGASEKIGKKIGLSPLAIGMLIVGFGTSLPEFFVSHIALQKGSVGIALGNIIGSNIANIFLILGISTVLTKVSMADDNIKENVIFHFVMTLLLAVTFLVLGTINYVSLCYFFIFFAVYLYFIYRDMKASKDFGIKPEEIEDVDTDSWKDNTFVQILTILIGFSLLFYGGDLLVSSGSDVCRALGISEFVISVIIVSIGTSLPELVTAVMAAHKKKHTDLIIGNILGSNIFNVAFILGSLGFYDFKLEATYIYEIALLLLISVVFLVMSYRKMSLGKFSGVIFLLTYIGLVFYWV